MMTWHDQLVGHPPRATNQPTNEGVPDPDAPYFDVTIAIDPDTDNIYVGDPCPGSDVIGTGKTNANGEWTRLEFIDGWHPVSLRQALADEREQVDEERAQAAVWRDTAKAMQQVGLKAVALGEQQEERLRHVTNGYRVMALTALDMCSGDDGIGTSAVRTMVTMFTEPPCDVCDAPLDGEDTSEGSEFALWRAAMSDAVRRFLTNLDDLEATLPPDSKEQDT